MLAFFGMILGIKMNRIVIDTKRIAGKTSDSLNPATLPIKPIVPGIMAVPIPPLAAIVAKTVPEFFL